MCSPRPPNVTQRRFRLKDHVGEARAERASRGGRKEREGLAEGREKGRGRGKKGRRGEGKESKEGREERRELA